MSLKKTTKKAKKIDTKTSMKKTLEKVKAIKEKQSRVEILQEIADQTNLKRVDVEAVFTEMAKLVRAHLRKQGSGEIMIPKLGVKIRKIRRKATKKRKMVSPLTGNEVEIAAKPARDDVKLVALKTLKETVLD
jgi:nucleoid DNA-binding protein